jgi:dihydrofolate synthase / folylpolyglutamate synthase
VPKRLSVQALQTSVYSQKDDLIDFLSQYLAPLGPPEESVLAITSKIVSLAEGRVVPKSLTKLELIKKEADLYLGEMAYGSHLAVKHGLLMASAGIDESNSSEQEYILFPQDPYASARFICEELKKRFGLKILE